MAYLDADKILGIDEPKPKKKGKVYFDADKFFGLTIPKKKTQTDTKVSQQQVTEQPQEQAKQVVDPLSYLQKPEPVRPQIEGTPFSFVPSDQAYMPQAVKTEEKVPEIKKTEVYKGASFEQSEIDEAQKKLNESETRLHFLQSLHDVGNPISMLKQLEPEVIKEKANNLAKTINHLKGLTSSNPVEFVAALKDEPLYQQWEEVITNADKTPFTLQRLKEINAIASTVFTPIMKAFEIGENIPVIGEQAVDLVMRNFNLAGLVTSSVTPLLNPYKDKEHNKSFQEQLNGLIPIIVLGFEGRLKKKGLEKKPINSTEIKKEFEDYKKEVTETVIPEQIKLPPEREIAPKAEKESTFTPDYTDSKGRQWQLQKMEKNKATLVDDKGLEITVKKKTLDKFYNQVKQEEVKPTVQEPVKEDVTPTGIKETEVKETAPEGVSEVKQPVKTEPVKEPKQEVKQPYEMTDYEQERTEVKRPISHKTWGEYDEWIKSKSDEFILQTFKDQTINEIENIFFSKEFFKPKLNEESKKINRINIASVYLEAKRRNLKIPSSQKLNEYLGIEDNVINVNKEIGKKNVPALKEPVKEPKQEVKQPEYSGEKLFPKILKEYKGDEYTDKVSGIKYKYKGEYIPEGKRKSTGYEYEPIYTEEMRKIRNEKLKGKVTEDLTPVEKIIVKEPRDKIPEAISEKVKEKAENLLKEVEDATVEKHGAYYNADLDKSTPAYTINTFPEWFRDLGMNKKNAINALRKIITDKGQDKGVSVEKVKKIILEHLTQGRVDRDVSMVSGKRTSNKEYFTEAEDKQLSEFLKRFEKDEITIEEFDNAVNEMAKRDESFNAETIKQKQLANEIEKLYNQRDELQSEIATGDAFNKAEKELADVNKKIAEIEKQLPEDTSFKFGKNVEEVKPEPQKEPKPITYTKYAEAVKEKEKLQKQYEESGNETEIAGIEKRIKELDKQINEYETKQVKKGFISEPEKPKVKKTPEQKYVEEQIRNKNIKPAQKQAEKIKENKRQDKIEKKEAEFKRIKERLRELNDAVTRRSLKARKEKAELLERYGELKKELGIEDDMFSKKTDMFGEGDISRQQYKQAKDNLGKLPDTLASVSPKWYLDRTKDLITIGKFHIEQGAKNFKDFTVRMVNSLGEWIKPKLKSLWNEINQTKLKEYFEKKGITLATSGLSITRKPGESLADFLARGDEVFKKNKKKPVIEKELYDSEKLETPEAKEIADELVIMDRIPEAPKGSTKLETVVQEIFNIAEPFERWSKKLGIYETKDDPYVNYFTVLNKSGMITEAVKGNEYPVFRRSGNFELHPDTVVKYLELIKDTKYTEKEFNEYVAYRRIYEDYQRLKQLEKLQNIETKLGNKEEALKIKEEYDELLSVIKEDGVSEKKSKEIVDKYKDTFAEPVKIFDKINEHTVDFAEETGLISKEFADKIRKSKGYASFQRYIENLTEVEGARVRPFSERKGSKRPIISPIFSQVASINYVMSKGLENVMWNKCYDMTKKSPELKARFKETTKPKGKLPEDILTFKKDGESIYIRTTPEFMKIYQNLRGVGERNAFLKVLRIASSVFTRGTTSAFPLFAPTNMTIDQISFLYNTRTGGKLLEPVLGLCDYIVNNNKPGTSANRYKTLGGKRQTLASYLDLQPEDMTKKLTHKEKGLDKVASVINSVIGVFEIPSNFSEIATRFTEFTRAKEKGRTDVEAMYLASQVTTPFQQIGRMGGKTGQALIRTIAYFNASLQVLYKFEKSSREHPIRAATVMGSVLTSGLAATMGVALFGTDDQKRLFANQSIESLTKSIFLPSPNGKDLISIRIPEQIGILTGTINLFVIDNMLHGNKAGLQDYFDVMSNALPAQFDVLNWKKALMNWMPTGAKTLYEIALNTRSYPDIMPIVPPYMENEKEKFQYNEYTSGVSKLIGDIFNISPMKVDYFIKNQLGRTWELLINPEKYAKIPLTMQEKYYQMAGRSYNTFYNLKENAEKDYNSLEKEKETVDKDYINTTIEKHYLYDRAGDLLSDTKKLLKETKELPSEYKDKVFKMLVAFDRNEEEEVLLKNIIDVSDQLYPMIKENKISTKNTPIKKDKFSKQVKEKQKEILKNLDIEDSDNKYYPPPPR